MNEEEMNITVEYLKMEDYEIFKEAMIKAYSNYPDYYWRREQIQRLLSIFPDGQAVVKVNGRVAGAALSLIVDSRRFEEKHTYKEVTANSTFATHNPNADVLYGIEVFVDPEFRGLRIGRRLYDFRKHLCEKLNLRCIIFGGRIPNYHKHSDQLTARQYIDKVREKEIHDPVLDFQLSNDFQPLRILTGYLGDEESGDNAVLLKWENIYFEEPIKHIRINRGTVRLGAIQWQMRTYKSIDEIILQAEFFIDSLSNYKSDFALFPEFFNAPLMSQFNSLNESDAIRKLAEFTEEIVVRFSKLAISYNINIITGSMPEIVNNVLLNVGYLCRRDGSTERYEKIHVTPDEAKVWAMKGGSSLRVFDTDCGRIGILICYDVEFPELSRILANDGMQILFVPFLTDTQNGYSRVRLCAHARAIENECYVVVAGSVGNLPNIHNMDIQYAQAAVFTPCDFSFPSNGIKAEATPNTEMILIADVDLSLLKELNKFGSVHNLNDRRTELYDVVWKSVK
ncbi:bifunctional GNAT family N-acetyltransferase/carbon-nitrogen hydrolase family protein [Leptospira sp. 96542]|nr:bifunctional GNAT family N-acetyltransferase/carbon-nitrogen hydrolase family protein [Leptospira sp. 96542]